MTSATQDLDLDQLLGEEPFVRGLARSLLFDEHQVDDVVQQTWLEALQASRITRSWLATVVRSRASNARRAGARAADRERKASRVEALPSTDELLEREESRRQVVEAVAGLPEKYRIVVLLRYYEGLPPRRIAAALGMGRDAVATRLKRALSMLREQLDAAHDGDRRSWALGLVPLALPGARDTVLAALVTNLGATFGALLTMKYGMVALGAAGALLFGWGWVAGVFSDAAPAPIVGSLEPSAAERATTVDEVGVVADPSAAPDRHVVAADPVRRAVPASVRAAMAGFRGILLTPEGEPAADQLVRIVGLDMVTAIGSVFDPEQLGDGVLGLGTISASARTASDGSFVVDGLPRDAMYALHAGVDGLHPTWKMLQHTAGPAEIVDLGTVSLTAKGRVTGRVVDEDGEPIAGADVWCSDLPGALLSVAPVDRLAPEGGLMVAIPRFQLDPDAASALAQYHESLRSHFAKRVTAMTDDTEFVALQLPGWFARVYDQLPIVRTVSDADGRFEIVGAQKGSAVLVVRADGYENGGKPRVLVHPNDVRDVGDVKLGRGEICAGRVLDAAGDPIAGAELRIAAQPRVGLTGILFSGRAHLTDARGGFRVAGLPREDAFVAVRRSVVDSWTVHGPFDAGDDAVEIRLGARTRVNLLVTSSDEDLAIDGVRIAVRKGPPLGELTLMGCQPELPVRATVEGANVELHDLEPGTYTVQVSANRHVVDWFVVDASAERADEVRTIELEPVAPTRVLVEDDRGAPVDGAQVFAQCEATAPWGRSILFGYGEVEVWDECARFVGFTESDGSLTLDVMPAGATVISVRHPGFGAGWTKVELPAEQAVVELSTCAVVHGRLFDGGVPASGVDYRLVAEPRGDMPMPRIGAQGAVREDGRYRIEGLAPGSYELRVESSLAAVESLGGMLDKLEIGVAWGWNDRREVEVELSAGEERELSFDVREEVAVPGTGGNVRIRVSVDGRPAVGYRIRMDDREQGAVGAGGEWLSAELAPQSYRVDVHDQDGFVVFSRHIDVATGNETSVVADLRMAEVTGAVIDAFGTPAAGHSVTLNGRVGTGHCWKTTTADDAGTFRLSVPAGRYAVLCEGLGGAGSVRDVDVAVGTVNRCDLRLSPDGVVAGRVRGEPKMKYVRFDSQDSIHTVRISDDGTFHIAFLQAGSYELSFHDDDFARYACRQARLELTEAGALGLQLDVGERVQ